MIIDRDRYIDQLSQNQGNGLIKIILGLRRSGKIVPAEETFPPTFIGRGDKGKPYPYHRYGKLGRTRSSKSGPPVGLGGEDDGG